MRRDRDSPGRPSNRADPRLVFTEIRSSCDIGHVAERCSVGLYETSEAAPIHLDGPTRCGRAGVSSEIGNTLGKRRREKQRHLELEAPRSTRGLPAR
jgi:hypothetical protein